MNAVLRSMDWSSGGIILFLSEAYNMVKETAKWVAATQKGMESAPDKKIRAFEVLPCTGVQVEEIPLGKSFPASGDSSVLDPLRAALQRYAGQVKLVIFSHITRYLTKVFSALQLLPHCTALA